MNALPIHRRRLLICAVLACLALPAAAGAGAWLQPPGRGYFRFSAGYLFTDERFDQDGNTVPFDTAGGFRNTTYGDFLGAFYGEVGLTTDWTVVGELTWKRVQAEQEPATSVSSGPGDFGVGIKRKLWRGLWNVGTGTLTLRFPTGYESGDYPSLGAGVAELTAWFQMGASSYKYWGNLDTFATLRGGDFRNQVGGVITMGWNPARVLGIRGELKGSAPIGSLPEPDPDQPFDPNAVDSAFLETALTGSWTVGGGAAIELEIRGAVAGRNTLKGPRISLAVATSPSTRLWGP